MHSTRERLRATLVELQQELSELKELDAATRQRLQATLADISTVLAKPEGPQDAVPGTEGSQPSIADAGDGRREDDESSQTLAERLNDATRGLESSHPQLSTTLGGVIHALGQMGI